MINRLEHVSDLKKFNEQWDERVIVQARAVLAVLDECYGKPRKVKEMGGFLLLCDMDTMVDDLNDIFKIKYSEYEWADPIDTDNETYIIVHYQLSADFAVVIIMSKALFEEVSKTEED